EHSGAPGVDGPAGERGQPVQAREAAAAEGEQRDQVRRVVEREAEAELVPAAVLVEKTGHRDDSGAQPERPVQSRLLARPEQVEKERRGDEEAHPLAVEADLERVELDLGKRRDGPLRVSPEEGVVEEAVR